MPKSQDHPDPRDNPWDKGAALLVPPRKTVYYPDPPPRTVVYLGQASGALEGLIAGWIYGGIAAILLSMFFGAIIGSGISVIAWRIRRRMRSFMLPFLLGITIEALGGGLIVWLARINAPKALEHIVSLFFAATIAIPFAILYMRLIRREVIATYRGLIAGIIIGSIGLGILGGIIGAQEIGGIAAIAICGFTGALMGIVYGCMFGPLLGGLVGALINVTRTSIAPTYGGLAAAIGLGLSGLYAGEAVAGGLGSLIGVVFGMVYGTFFGVNFGKLMTPHLLAVFTREDEKDPDYPPILDLSDPRELADADPVHLTLCEMLLLAIRSHFQRIRIEQWETAYIATLLTDNSSSTYSWPLPLDPALIQILKDLTCIESNESSRLTGRQERQLRLRLSRHRLDMCLAYQRNLNGERIDLRWNDEPAAAKRAERISNALHFILKARASFDAQVHLGRKFT